MKSIPTSHRYLTGILLFLYLLASLKSFQPYINYSINYNYISSELCENKEKPKLQCNGKCFLKKELKKVSKEESQKKEINSKVLHLETLPGDKLTISFNNHLIFSNQIKFPTLNEAVHSLQLEQSTPPPRI